MKFIARNKWKTLSLNTMKSQLHYFHTTYCSCIHSVNSVHEYFTGTDSHLQISQHHASLKHENSYTILLPQNIFLLQLHFSCTLTLYSINNLRFTKLGLVGMVVYLYMFLI